MNLSGGDLTLQIVPTSRPKVAPSRLTLPPFRRVSRVLYRTNKRCPADAGWRLFVNFPKTLLLLLVMVAFVATGCGKSEQEKTLDKIKEERKALLENSLKDIDGLAKSSAELKAGNDTLKAAFRQLDEQLITQSAKFAEMSKRLDELNQKLNQTTAQLNADEQKAMTASSFSLLKLLLLVVLVGLVIFVIVRLLRSRSEFEEEDEDYSDFEEDDELGFEGDDDGGDDEDPSRKKPDTKKPDGDSH